MKKNLIFCIILCLFCLWCCDVDCSDSNEENASKKKTYYKIILHYDGLTPASGYQLDNLTYDGSYSVNLPLDTVAFVLESNEHVSWYDNSTCSGEPVTQIPKGSTGDKEFWAKKYVE